MQQTSSIKKATAGLPNSARTQIVRALRPQRVKAEYNGSRARRRELNNAHRAWTDQPMSEAQIERMYQASRADIANRLGLSLEAF